MGGKVMITVPNGVLGIGGGAGAVTITGRDVDLSARSINVGSVTGTASTRVLATGSAAGTGTLVITTGAGDLQVQGGSGPGAFAELVSTRGTSVVVNGGSLFIRGGSGAGAYALIDPTQAGDLSITISGGGLTLDGGGGASASARLQNLSGNITSNVVPVFVKNTGNDADAVVVVGAGRTVSFAGLPQTTVSGDPVGNGRIDAGIFMIEPPVPVLPLVPAGIDSVFQGAMSNLPQAGPALPAPPVPTAKGDVVVESDDGC